MAAVADLERLLERVFERTSARIFRSRVQLVQAERRVERAMEAGRTGRGASTVVPNRYRVRLHPADLDDLAGRTGGSEVLAARLADAALAFARLHAYHLPARPTVSVIADPIVERGTVEVDASVMRSTSPAPAPPPIPSVPDAPPTAETPRPIAGVVEPRVAVAADAEPDDDLAGVVAAPHTPGPPLVWPIADAPAAGDGGAPAAGRAAEDLAAEAVGPPPADVVEPLPAASAPAVIAAPAPAVVADVPAADAGPVGVFAPVEGLGPAPAGAPPSVRPSAPSLRNSSDRPYSVRPAVPVPAQALLRVSEPGGRERVLQVEGRPLTLGRAPDNDLVIADGRVSRHHGRFQTRHGTLVYTDLGSTNGTRVNGIRVDEIVLGAGDRLQVGDVVVVVEQLPR